MNVLCSVHLYPPQHLCGAEFMLHAINKHLQSKGHTVKVMLHQANHYKIDSHYVYDDIDVFPSDDATIMNLFRWADVVITHLDYAKWSMHMAGIHGLPCVHLIHNTYEYPYIVDADHPQFIVYNSEWASKKLNYKHENIIVPPACDYNVYNTNIDASKNEYITLINLDFNKGGHILAQIAEKMPDKKFIGVKGSYSEPAKDGQYTQQPTNVHVWEKQVDIRKVYGLTRILIMPSKYESWGRTATEAMASGIPVICTSTPGLLENCGEAGIYIQDRDNVGDWVKEIKRLDEKKAYSIASKKAKERSIQHDPRESLNKLERFILDAKKSYK